MTSRTRAVLNTNADTNIEDNTTKNITPADVRAMLKDLADSTFNLNDDASPTFVNATLTGYLDIGEISAPASPAANYARMWTEDNNGFSVMHWKDSSGLDHELARDLLHVVRNTTGSTISKGKAVYISGSTGFVPNIALARADSASTVPVFGLVVADIANNSFGQVMTSGDIQGVDTSAFAAGDILYLDSAVAGGFTTTIPTGTNIVQRVGVVIASHATNGVIAITPTFAFNPALTQTFTNKTISLASNTLTGVATDSILGRATAGTGDVEALTALPFAFTGDVTRPADSNVQTIADNAVTLAKMATMATDSILGRATAGTGNAEVLTALPFAFTGDVTRPADSNVQTIANDAVTYAKMQNVSATDRLLGRSTAGAGDVEEIVCTAAGRALLDDANAAAQLVTLGAAAAADIVGQQTIWVPAQAMVPRTTNGAAAAVLELATNDVMISYLAFDSTTSEGAQFAIQMPKGWDEGTIIAQFIWTHPATTTNFGVRWGLRATAHADSGAMDAAFGTAQEVTDTGGTTNDCWISPETAAITIAGAPTPEEYCIFEVRRMPADAADTMAVDAYLLGVKIHYTTDAAKDD